MPLLSTAVVVASCVVLGGEAKETVKTPVEKGTVAFKPKDKQENVPERYRLAEHKFEFEMNKKPGRTPAGVEAWQIRFPSAVESPHKENNIVHCEYYRPVGKGPFPAVITLDITQGNQIASRT